MKVWKVGGAVRDALLGRPCGDTDWVVTGATPKQMVAAGYTPVGRDFPVFLHPTTKEEYALARTERSTAPGYHGFVFHTAPDVTLEQDLQRRDLTINAMAVDADGTLIDPYGGQRDVAARLLRHVSAAFAEDPVRILRLARFAARFDDFSVAPETAALMRQMVDGGEADALVAERVWQELSRGLMESHPSRMLDVLHDCGALARLLPEVDANWRDTSDVATLRQTHLRHALDAAARRGAPLPVRFAILTHRLGSMHAPDALAALCERWRIPTDCRELAELLLRERHSVQRSAAMDAEALVGLLDSADAWRRPERFELLLQACDIIASAHAEDDDGPEVRPCCKLRSALRRASALDTSVIAQRATAAGERGPAIGAAIHQARVLAVEDELSDEDND
jgi:tRNA nucleotidyltransferase (CCA-adding enzyme)